MIKRFLSKTLIVVLVFSLLVSGEIFLAKIPKTHAADFNAGYVIDDNRFVDSGSMSEADIQRFLENKGSFLKDYTVDGKSASKIIYDAAQGVTSGRIWDNFGHSDWNEDVRISPKVLLATMQKEEGLVSGYWASPDRWNDGRETLEIRLKWAMGYGYTESTVYNQYSGFYNQVNFAAWQLFWNYRRSTLGNADYQVGQTMVFDDQSVRLENRATASLYRYTPHIQYGFYNNYTQFFGPTVGEQKRFQGELISQTSNPGDQLSAGGTYQVEVKYLNTGVNQWIKGEVNLGTTNPNDRKSIFNNGDGWIAIGADKNRIKMSEDVVWPGEYATFKFTFKAPDVMPNIGYTAQEYFKLVKDVGGDLDWFSDDTKIQFSIPLKGVDSTYRHQYVSQNAYPTLNPGESAELNLTVKNTGTATWTKDTVRLGTSKPTDRVPFYIRGAGWKTDGDGNRILMQEESVTSGQEAHFKFSLTIPADYAPGMYREYFRLVADNITWMEDYGIYWDITINSYQHQWISQSAYPTLRPGDSNEFNLTVKNTGTATWTKDTVRLGTSKPTDRVPFYIRGAGWKTDGDGNRILMQEESVAPGQEAHFKFSITIPEGTQPAVFREYFRLVADNITWMEDYGIYWDIKVPTAAERYNSQWVSQNYADGPGQEPISLYSGQTNTFMVKFKNTGLDTWTKDKVFLGTSRNQDRISQFSTYGIVANSGWVSPNRIEMQENSAAPGQTATFIFQIKTPNNLPAGEYQEYFQLVAEYITWMQDLGVYWRIKIQ